MPETPYKRQRLGSFSLRNSAADACRYIQVHKTHAEVDCPRCAETVRTRHLREDVRLEGGPLHGVLLDHLFHACPAVEVAR
jgi:hypothetical protein